MPITGRANANSLRKISCILCGMLTASMDNTENKLLPLPEVARRLSVSVMTVRRLIDEGKLRRIKVRGAVRVRTSDFNDYLNLIAA